MLAWFALCSSALAAPEGSVGGDVKAFFLAVAPRPWFVFSEEAAAALEVAGVEEEEALSAYGLGDDPVGQGVLSGRLKGTAKIGVVRGDLHLAAAASTPGTSGFGLGTGVGTTAPELVPLSWVPDLGGQLELRARVDRLMVSVKGPGVDVTLGRQPVSFGSGRVFTPMDLVNPFHPATIDTEYKPGVDALRVDVYPGASARITAVAAWAGSPVVGDDARDAEAPLLDDLVLALHGQGTVGVTDLAGFAGLVYAEPVVGLGVVSGIGAVGLHGDATVTFPEVDDPFVRAVVGADGRPTSTTSLSGEVYVQTFGGATPEDYLDVASSERFARGEVWQMGRVYGALAVAQELTPLVAVNGAVIGNVLDPSALVSLGGSWSVADDAVVAFGGYVGLGAAAESVEVGLGVDPTTGGVTLLPPTDAELAASVRSEFGLYPALGYVQLRAYF